MTDLDALKAADDLSGLEKRLISEIERLTAENEALRASAQGARKLLKRTPPATRSMYVGTNKEPWGKQAASVAKSLEAAMKGQTP
jgi:Mrp family chromosome partitioning ATPase